MCAVHDKPVADTVDRNDLSVLDAVEFGVVIGDGDARASHVNNAWMEMTGQTHTTSVGDGWLRVLDKRGTTPEHESLVAAIRARCRYETDFAVDDPLIGRRWLRMRVQPHQSNGARLTGFVATLSDVTEARLTSAELRKAAAYDGLTGVLNRNQFMEFVHHALDGRRRHPTLQCALLFVDVDLLKVVNDRDGHAAGDRTLIAAARVLEGVVRPTDVVGRFGGDEFVVLCDDLVERNEAIAIGRRIITAGQLGHTGWPAVRLSVGLAFAESVDDDGEALIRRADRAMYRAKHDGGGRLAVA